MSVTDAERETLRKQMRGAANQLYDHFDSVVVLASVVRDGITFWHAQSRGNDFANSDLARRFTLGEFDPIKRENEDDDD